MLTPDRLMNPTTETPPPPADRFRFGDIWRSPRGKDWQVDKIESGIARLRALHNRHSTQWRGIYDTGRDTPNAWERIKSAATPFVYPD
jgi:hypothetical protein